MALGPGDLAWLSGRLVPPILLPPGLPHPPQQGLFTGRCLKLQPLDRGEPLLFCVLPTGKVPDLTRSVFFPCNSVRIFPESLVL